MQWVLTVIDALNPVSTVGIFIGALIPFVFSSFLMESVGYAANLMVEEVRRQVKTIKGLMEGKAKPDYAKAVDIATINAIKSLAVPELIAIVTPIAVGLVLGKAGTWRSACRNDTCKPYACAFHGKQRSSNGQRKEVHRKRKVRWQGQRCAQGSSSWRHLGDPLKDTAGPALNSMIKVISTISILLAPVFMTFVLIH